MTTKNDEHGLLLETNKVYCGDCLEIMKELPDNSVDCVVTDPPYGIGIHKMSFTKSRNGGVAMRNDYSGVGDWDSESFNKTMYSEIRRVSKNQIVFGANHFSDILEQFNCWVVWDKKVHDDYSNDFADCEIAWTSFNKPSRMIRHLWHGMIQHNMKYKEARCHPTQKPVLVIEKIITLFTDNNDTILDPFLGSGTTAVAAIRTGRRFIGIEIDPKYCEIAQKRIDQELAQGDLFVDKSMYE